MSFKGQPQKKKRKKRQLFSGKRLKDVEQIKMTQKNQKYFANFLLFDSILIHIRYLLINFYNSGKCFSFFFLLLYSENLRKKFAAIYEKKRGNDVTFGKDRKSINIGRIQRWNYKILKNKKEISYKQISVWWQNIIVYEIMFEKFCNIYVFVNVFMCQFVWCKWT